MPHQNAYEQISEQIVAMVAVMQMLIMLANATKKSEMINNNHGAPRIAN